MMQKKMQKRKFILCSNWINDLSVATGGPLLLLPCFAADVDLFLNELIWKLLLESFVLDFFKLFNGQPLKMVKHTQTINWQFAGK